MIKDLRQINCGGANRHRFGCDARLAANPFGHREGFMKAAMEDRAKRA
jgi:hypothetical protein